MEALLVGIDVGCRRHRVAVGMPDGALLDQFDLEHQPTAFSAFFSRIEKLAAKHGLPVSVGMEGYGGWARPLDEMVLAKGWKLLNVNNLKLARYKEIFPSPAKTDAIDARKILELMRLRPLLPQAISRGSGLPLYHFLSLSDFVHPLPVTIPLNAPLTGFPVLSAIHNQPLSPCVNLLHQTHGLIPAQ